MNSEWRMVGARVCSCVFVPVSSQQKHEENQWCGRREFRNEYLRKRVKRHFDAATLLLSMSKEKITRKAEACDKEERPAQGIESTRRKEALAEQPRSSQLLPTSYPAECFQTQHVTAICSLAILLAVGHFCTAQQFMATTLLLVLRCKHTRWRLRCRSVAETDMGSSRTACCAF